MKEEIKKTEAPTNQEPKKQVAGKSSMQMLMKSTEILLRNPQPSLEELKNWEKDWIDRNEDVLKRKWFSFNNLFYC